MVNEGLARWTYEDPDAATQTGIRHCGVPAPARRRREACRPRRWDAPRLGSDEAGSRARAPPRRPRARPAPPLGRRRPGSPRVRAHADGAPRAPHRADGPRRRAEWARCGWRGCAAARRGDAGVPVPGVVAVGERDELGELAGVERLEGRRSRAKSCATPNGPTPPRPDRPVPAAPWPPSTPSTRRRSRASRRPTRWAIPCPSSMRWARSGPRSSWACAGWPPTARRTGRGWRCTATTAWATSWSGPTGCAASSTGSSPTPATRPRTSAGSAHRHGASAAAATSAASARSPHCWAPTTRRAATP